MTTLDRLACRKLSLLALAHNVDHGSQACKLLDDFCQQSSEIRRNFRAGCDWGPINHLPGTRGARTNRVVSEAYLEAAGHRRA